MIEHIKITGFQCHRNLEIAMDQIVVIVGDNDAGKSAVLRSVRWLTLNEWEGKATDFINWDMEECQVKMTVDGKQIERTRSKSRNHYHLDGKEFAAFGTRVPSEIANVLNLSPNNFQGQLDAAFWVSLKSGEAASELNQIFNLTAIDDAIDVAAREVREAKTRKTICEERLSAYTETVHTLSWVVEADQVLKQLSALQADLDQNQTQIETLKSGVEEMQALQKEMKSDEEALATLNKVLAKAEELGKLDAKIELVSEFITLEEQLEDMIGQKNKAEELLTEALRLCPMCGRESKT